MTLGIATNRSFGGYARKGAIIAAHFGLSTRADATKRHKKRKPDGVCAFCACLWFKSSLAQRRRGRAARRRAGVRRDACRRRRLNRESRISQPRRVAQASLDVPPASTPREPT